MWRWLLEAAVLGGACLLFAGSVSMAEIVVAVFAGAGASAWHAWLARRSAFRFQGTPKLLALLQLAVKSSVLDLPAGAWRALAALWRRRYGQPVVEPAPVVVRATRMQVIPKQRALAILVTSCGPLVYAIEAHLRGLRVHRAARDGGRR